MLDNAAISELLESGRLESDEVCRLQQMEEAAEIMDAHDREAENGDE